MVFYTLSLVFFLIINGDFASKYYYKKINGDYDVYHGPVSRCGYKEFKPPKSYKVDYKDRGDRPGKCIKGEFQCNDPFPIADTKIFECEVDYQCPRFFKCCRNVCFRHKICQPIDFENIDENETCCSEQAVTKTTLEIFTTEESIKQSTTIRSTTSNQTASTQSSSTSKSSLSPGDNITTTSFQTARPTFLSTQYSSTLLSNVSQTATPTTDGMNVSHSSPASKTTIFSTTSPLSSITSSFNTSIFTTTLSDRTTLRYNLTTKYGSSLKTTNYSPTSELIYSSTTSISKSDSSVLTSPANVTKDELITASTTAGIYTASGSTSSPFGTVGSTTYRPNSDITKSSSTYNTTKLTPITLSSNDTTYAFTFTKTSNVTPKPTYSTHSTPHTISFQNSTPIILTTNEDKSETNLSHTSVLTSVISDRTTKASNPTTKYTSTSIPQLNISSNASALSSFESSTLRSLVSSPNSTEKILYLSSTGSASNNETNITTTFPTDVIRDKSSSISKNISTPNITTTLAPSNTTKSLVTTSLVTDFVPMTMDKYSTSPVVFTTIGSINNTVAVLKPIQNTSSETKSSTLPIKIKTTELGTSLPPNTIIKSSTEYSVDRKWSTAGENLLNTSETELNKNTSDDEDITFSGDYELSTSEYMSESDSTAGKNSLSTSGTELTKNTSDDEDITFSGDSELNTSTELISSTMTNYTKAAYSSESPQTAESNEAESILYNTKATSSKQLLNTDVTLTTPSVLETISSTAKGLNTDDEDLTFSEDDNGTDKSSTNVSYTQTESHINKNTSRPEISETAKETATIRNSTSESKQNSDAESTVNSTRTTSNLKVEVNFKLTTLPGKLSSITDDEDLTFSGDGVDFDSDKETSKSTTYVLYTQTKSHINNESETTENTNVETKKTTSSSSSLSNVSHIFNSTSSHEDSKTTINEQTSSIKDTFSTKSIPLITTLGKQQKSSTAIYFTTRKEMNTEMNNENNIITKYGTTELPPVETLFQPTTKMRFVLGQKVEVED